VKKLAAEFIGTFALVFAGTGGIVINETTGGAVTHVGVALTFGLIVLAMIYTVGDISGAHLNPAVSLGFFAARRFPLRQMIPYIGSQCAGALAASGILRVLFPQSAMLGATVPTGPASQSFALEAILTAILMFAILGVSTGAAEKGITAGIVVGCCDWTRSNVRGADLRSVNEPSAVLGAGCGFEAHAVPLDLPARSRDWRFCRCAGLPLCARIRMLLKFGFSSTCVE
jgi:major intrinsic protein